ncbi:MAG TPA: SRPBCC family protein [Actinomycetes bacterium]|nr:SRPBCC family protein [Actinomycetes bacterium]
MRIENTVEVDAPLDRVWALVNDIPRVAPCMPGAALTGVLDDDTYEGTVAVKLGPLRMSYKGKVVVEGVDEASHSARLAATGKDTKGAGTARAAVETRLEPVGDTRTRLHVTSDVQLTGKVASFGRGGAINDVATRLFGQFADCLRATLESEQAPATSAEEAGTTTEATAATGATAAEPARPQPSASASPSPAASASSSPSVSASPAEGAASDAIAATPATSPPAVPASSPQAPAPRPVEALDAGSLVGTVIKGRLAALFQAIAGFFRRLFGRRSTS